MTSAKAVEAKIQITKNQSGQLTARVHVSQVISETRLALSTRCAWIISPEVSPMQLFHSCILLRISCMAFA